MSVCCRRQEYQQINFAHNTSPPAGSTSYSLSELRQANNDETNNTDRNQYLVCIHVLFTSAGFPIAI
jgi:hypothetical protein